MAREPSELCLPVIGELSVEAIDVALAMKIVEPLWNTKTETGTRARGRIEAVLDWAAARGYLRGENPARWRGHLENLLPKPSKVQPVAHDAALPYGKVPAVIAELRRRGGIGALALEFLILTAGRLGEVTGARWCEINLADRVWIVPGGAHEIRTRAPGAVERRREGPFKATCDGRQSGQA